MAKVPFPLPSKETHPHEQLPKPPLATGGSTWFNKATEAFGASVIEPEVSQSVRLRAVDRSAKAVALIFQLMMVPGAEFSGGCGCPVVRWL